MPKLTSFPEFDSSSSATKGDDHRIVLMKGALLSELVQQPCILKVFAHWAVAITNSPQPVTAQAVARLLGADAVRLVQELGLPYAWVAQGVLHGFVAGIEAMVAGQEIVLPLPQIFEARNPMEKRPTGRRPDEDALTRYAQWYVRNRVSGITVNKLAQEYHQAHHTHQNYRKNHTWTHDRKTVFDGIKEIDRLLKFTR